LIGADDYGVVGEWHVFRSVSSARYRHTPRRHLDFSAQQCFNQSATLAG